MRRLAEEYGPKWRVFCQATRPLPGTQATFCDWTGYRTAETRERAVAKPCPKCAGAVSAVPLEDDRG